MKTKLLPGTFGVGLVWDSFTRSLVFSFLGFCVKFHWPRVGACKFCGHGPDKHTARRSRGLIEWRCTQLMRAAGSTTTSTCECEHYEPERA